MGILEMAARFFGTGSSGVLQQNAGDDLEAVGDAMADLLQQDAVRPQGVLLQRRIGPGVCHIRYGDQNTGLLQVEINQPSCLNDQVARRPSGLFENDFFAVRRLPAGHNLRHQ